MPFWPVLCKSWYDMVICFAESTLSTFYSLLGCYSCCALNLVCIDAKDSLCSQGNQGELLSAAAQTGVEQSVPQAARGWVRAPYYSLSLSAAVFWICYYTTQLLHLSPFEDRPEPAKKNTRRWNGGTEVSPERKIYQGEGKNRGGRFQLIFL